MNKRLATLFGFLTTFFTDRRITNIYIVLLILLCLIPAIIIAVFVVLKILNYSLTHQMKFGL